MIKVTNGQIAKFLKESDSMAGVDFENERGEIASDLYALCTTKQLAYTFRMKALEKKRARILKDHAQVDSRGEIRYGDSPDGDPAKRPVLWKNQKAADAAFGAWVKDVEAVDNEEVILDFAPLKNDFFLKPTEVNAKLGVRNAVRPFMAKAQAALKAAVPKKRKG